MEVYKKINNNVALARDAKGRELVVFGKGIGFASMPYELTDLSRIQRTFYDVNEKYLALLRDVPEAVFLAADDIADTAREELDCTLNANLTYALADHLNFAIQRSREGLNVQVPLAYDIQHLYPHEYAIAKQGLHELCRTLAVDLPDTEIVSIAMHIITAENEVGDMHSTILTAKVISELSAIVEHGMEIQLNKESFSYSRFCMHLRYLVQRMMHGSPLDAGKACSLPCATSTRRSIPAYSRSTPFCTAPTGGSAAKKNSCTSSCISTASALSARRIELFSKSNHTDRYLYSVCRASPISCTTKAAPCVAAFLWSEIG